MQLTECIFLSRILLGRLVSGLHLVDVHRDIERGIGFLPNSRVCPVIVLVSTINDRIEGRVNFPTFPKVTWTVE